MCCAVSGVAVRRGTRLRGRWVKECSHENDDRSMAEETAAAGESLSCGHEDNDVLIV